MPSIHDIHWRIMVWAKPMALKSYHNCQLSIVNCQLPYWLYVQAKYFLNCSADNAVVDFVHRVFKYCACSYRSGDTLDKALPFILSSQYETRFFVHR